jgi:hypothetical protein
MKPVDVWALGIILYRLLTSQCLFNENDEPFYKEKVIKNDVKYPSYYYIEQIFAKLGTPMIKNKLLKSYKALRGTSIYLYYA